MLQTGLAERWRGGARAFRKAPFLLESVPTTGWPIPSRKNADMSAVRRGEPARAPIANVHRGCLGGCPADEPPRHPGPYRANWRAVRCQGPPGPCLGAAGASPGAHIKLAGPFLQISLLYQTKQNKTTEVVPAPRE